MSIMSYHLKSIQYLFYTLYIIYTLFFTAWLIFLVYTFENTNALEHIFICGLLGVLCFGLIRSISKTSFNPPKETVDTGSRRCPQCSQNFLI